MKLTATFIFAAAEGNHRQMFWSALMRGKIKVQPSVAQTLIKRRAKKQQQQQQRMQQTNFFCVLVFLCECEWFALNDVVCGLDQMNSFVYFEMV